MTVDWTILPESRCRADGTAVALTVFGLKVEGTVAVRDKFPERPFRLAIPIVSIPLDPGDRVRSP